MRFIKPFEEYIKERIVKTVSPDIQRANFLISEFERSFKSLKKRLDVLGIDDDSSSSIMKDCYDILMELI